MAVTVDLRLSIKRLCDDEMIVAFESMAVDACIVIAAVAQRLFERDCCFGQVIDMESDILDQSRCAELTCAADCRKYA
jgi:hypothetical protein